MMELDWKREEIHKDGNEHYPSIKLTNKIHKVLCEKK